MNVTEKNILIAEFMCFKLQTDPTENFFGQWLINEPNEIAWSNREKILFFECDWNWLMQVVEKIESLNNSDFIIEYTSVMMPNVFGSKQFIAKTKIQAVYNACVEFVLWFNENKK